MVGEQYNLKLALLGSAAVGKTSLIKQYVEKYFNTDYIPTLGVNILTKDIYVEEADVNVRLVLWDIAGQEKYAMSRAMFFQGCVGALLVYDITRTKTFDSIESVWMKDFVEFGKKDGVYVVIGNKIDLTDSRTIDTEKGRELAKRIKAADFIETSALRGDNVEEAFKKLVHIVLRSYGVKI